MTQRNPTQHSTTDHPKYGLINYLSLLALCFGSMAQTAAAAPPDIDVAAAQTHLKKEWPGMDLHAQSSFPDGAKGLVAPVLTSAGTFSSGPPFESPSDWLAFYAYCHWDAIVLARNVDSTPVLTSAKDTIFTVSHFVALQTVKSDGAIKVGQSFATYQLGGEVEDAGERLRIETPQSPAYRSGKTYLLLDERDAIAAKIQYAVPNGSTILVSNGRIYPTTGAWADFQSGTALTNVVAAFNRVSKLKVCPAP